MITFWVVMRLRESNIFEQIKSFRLSMISVKEEFVYDEFVING